MKNIEDKPKCRKYLRKHGFRSVSLKDKSGYWMQRDIKHPFLKKVEVCVETEITVYALDVDCKNHAAIYSCTYSAQKLQKVLNWLTTNHNDTTADNTGL